MRIGQWEWWMIGVIALLLAGVVAWRFGLWQQASWPSWGEPEVTTVGHTVDNATLSDRDLRGLEALLLSHFSASDSETETSIVVREQEGDYVFGTIRLPEQGQRGWYAYKSDAGWQLITEGTGVPACEPLAQADVPLALIDTCIDETGLLQSRGR